MPALHRRTVRKFFVLAVLVCFVCLAVRTQQQKSQRPEMPEVPEVTTSPEVPVHLSSSKSDTTEDSLSLEPGGNQDRLLFVYASTIYGEVRIGPDRTSNCTVTRNEKLEKVEVVFSSDIRRAKVADALIFYTDSSKYKPFSSTSENPRYPVPLMDRVDATNNRQVNVWWNEEPTFSAQHAEFNQEAMANFPVWKTFHPHQMKSNFPGQICYVDWGLREWGDVYLAPVVPFAERRADFMAVWISSHCHQGSEGKDYSARVTLVRQLSEYVSIARFGKCGHNVDWDTNVEGDRKAQDKSLEKIKFLLSFENNVCEFYMSEKIWKAYALGMVPVIYAAPSVVDVLPANDSFINVRDFSSVKELGAGLSAACNTLYCVGAYLAKVAEDERLYMSFFAWKRRPISELSPGFQSVYYSKPGDCCMVQGVTSVLQMFKAGQVPPKTPNGLTCDAPRLKLLEPQIECDIENWGGMHKCRQKRHWWNILG